MSPSFKKLEKSLPYESMSPEEQERAEILEEIVHKSTQFGIGNWNYEGTYEFDEDRF